ncbi:PhnD/SsuA/transferrin family substrate-binding protein [Wenzhouxiangella sp. XN24]|uniref:PhnD/SsuA/transferrin family substrate-binding protein n=1 Tax=Wenzhouxiangella sp. XN24 TaxID=2713569 RepID=UPI0013EBB2E1|nr:PhnD/SsuA/transferrin family substrate-binding protein [Wenzhouxiangella sp. XN24]NGX15703.1 PhnD/SsuA/transferrin family substrate-binding protein [Wenzhouxiangella sp. XN24]
MVGHRFQGWIATLLLCSPAAAMPAESLVFVPLPMENPRNTVAHSKALAAHFQRLHGGPVAVRHLADYDEILRAFVADEIDLLHLGPLPLHELQRMAPHAVAVVALLGSDGEARYTCALASPTDSVPEPGEPGSSEGPRAPARIALTQPISTCGYLASGWLLQQGGADIDEMSADYLGSHEAVALALVGGKYALGGLKRKIADRYSQLGLRVIAETDPLPGFVLVANGRTMTLEQIETLRAGLLATDANILSGLELGRHGFAPVDELSLGTIERMIRETGFRVPAGPGY